jgi:hypothetical protein
MPPAVGIPLARTFSLQRGEDKRVLRRGLDSPLMPASVCRAVMPLAGAQHTEGEGGLDRFGKYSSATVAGADREVEIAGTVGRRGFQRPAFGRRGSARVSTERV